MTNKESDLICTQPCRDSGNIFLLVKHSAFMTRKCAFYVKDCCTVLQIRTTLKCTEFHIVTFKLIMQYVLHQVRSCIRAYTHSLPIGQDLFSILRPYYCQRLFVCMNQALQLRIGEYNFDAIEQLSWLMPVLSTKFQCQKIMIEPLFIKSPERFRSLGEEARNT